jgi:hypothetical protein
VVATVRVTVRQMNFSPALRISTPGQKAHLGQHLKAVADAQHIAAPVGMGAHGGSDRRLRGNGAAAQVVAVGKAARHAHHIGALGQGAVLVPDPRHLEPGASKATARSRSQFEPGKVTTAAFMGFPFWRLRA